MSVKRKLLIVAACILGSGVLGLVWWRNRTPQPKELDHLTGAVLRQDADVRKQVPVVNADLNAAMGGVAVAHSRSDRLGYFRLNLRPKLRSGQPLKLTIRHPDYAPFDLAATAEDRIYVIRMAPVDRDPPAASNAPLVDISGVRLRYAVKSTTMVNVGTTVRTFEVINTANVPCRGKRPCSPDGKWKATIGGFSVDAGAGNEFRNARLSCIAGPCSFTAIEYDGFSAGGPRISASVRNWCDPTTFLVEAEVVRTMATDTVRLAFPAIVGQTMTFTLPPGAQGASIQAEVHGSEIIFPLGPSLTLSWATCSGNTGPDQGRRYRCELKPGYRFVEVK
jgi:hypothetical protein